MKPLNRIFANSGVTIFTRMSELAKEHGAINLGQGFSTDAAPSFLREAAAKIIEKGPHQYPPMLGVGALRSAVAEQNRALYGLNAEEKNVLVTCGGTQALAACLEGMLNPGDEVVLLEPCYDSYIPLIRNAGAIPKLVRLNPPDWKLDQEKLEAAFSDKTKLIIVNTPMNPVAKTFSREELSIIADLVKKYDAYAISDEVYEHLVFGGEKHHSLLQISGMDQRAVRIGSASKTFSVTGWRVGYITGPEHLITPISRIHQFQTFATPIAEQYGVAAGLRHTLEPGNSYFSNFTNDFESKRNIIVGGLEKIGFGVLPCEGTFFQIADFAPLGFEGNDVEFCEWLTREGKVTAIPLSAFYAPGGEPPPRSLIRFCFARDKETLEKAVTNMTRIFENPGIENEPVRQLG